MNCTQCQMVAINGFACHEIGCPNMGKAFRDGEWMHVYHCAECGCEHTRKEDLAECCSPAEKPQPALVTILSIDAWRDGDSWTWNNWFKRGMCDPAVCDRKPREILRYMRAAGYLSHASAGKVAIEDDQYNIVIVDRHTREPLFAIAYGDAQS